MKVAIGLQLKYAICLKSIFFVIDLLHTKMHATTSIPFLTFPKRIARNNIFSSLRPYKKNWNYLKFYQLKPLSSIYDLKVSIISNQDPINSISFFRPVLNTVLHAHRNLTGSFIYDK